MVRLKGGDPFVFGRGGEEAEALRRAGVDFEVVPGVSSAFAAPAAAGIPVTHRGLATSVSVVTGHVGDPSAARGVDWDSLGRAGGTLVILMGMSERARIADALMAGGRDADTPVAVVHWGTTEAQQEVARTTLADLAAVELPAPAVIVVGAGGRARPRLRPTAPADRDGDRPRPSPVASVVVTRCRSQASVLVDRLAGLGPRWSSSRSSPSRTPPMAARPWPSRRTGWPTGPTSGWRSPRPTP